jgi:hypothetical protein
MSNKYNQYQLVHTKPRYIAYGGLTSENQMHNANFSMSDPMSNYLRDTELYLGLSLKSVRAGC